MNQSKSIPQLIYQYDKDTQFFMSNDVDVKPGESDGHITPTYMVPYNMKDYVRNVNTGFQIWWLNNVTRDIITLWSDQYTIYPDRNQFMLGWPWEQGSFNHYIRPFLPAGVFQPLDCEQTNGFPAHFMNGQWRGHGSDRKLVNMGNYGCNGTFVSHLWMKAKIFNQDKLTAAFKRDVEYFFPNFTAATDDAAFNAFVIGILTKIKTAHQRKLSPS